jgi:hypothetical protein
MVQLAGVFCEIVEGARAALTDHTTRCGDEVHALAINSANFDLLDLTELWGIPVLAWDEVPPMRVRLLCESYVRLEKVHGGEQPPDTVEAPFG